MNAEDVSTARSAATGRGRPRSGMAAAPMPGSGAADLRHELARYRYTYTTGPICLPSSAHSIDWGVLNDEQRAQTIRVTVFKCNLGGPKTVEAPGPLTLTLDPGETTHNANAAMGGFFYEIAIDCNSPHILPYMSAWAGTSADPLPGSVVTASQFMCLSRE